MKPKSLKKLQDDAQKARQNLAELEAQFAGWRELPRTSGLTETDLDAWIIRLGDARHLEAVATKAVIANTPKDDQ